MKGVGVQLVQPPYLPADVRDPLVGPTRTEEYIGGKVYVLEFKTLLASRAPVARGLPYLLYRRTYD